MATHSEKPALVTVGDRVRALMQAKGLSQTVLATKSGIDRSDVNRIVQNRRPPRLNELPLLAAVLATTIEDLLRGVELPPEYRRELEKQQQGALRIIEAEAARDEAVKQAMALREALAEAGRMIDQEREQAAQGRQRLAADHAERLARVEREKAALDAALGESRREAFELRSRIADHEGTVAALRDEVAGLRKSLADANSAKALTGMLTDIARMAGTAVGERLAKSGSGSDKDD